MRSAILDFKNSEFIHTILKIQDKSHQIAYSNSSGTFSLEVRLKAKKGNTFGKEQFGIARCSSTFTKGVRGRGAQSNFGRL